MESDKVPGVLAGRGVGVALCGPTSMQILRGFTRKARWGRPSRDRQTQTGRGSVRSRQAIGTRRSLLPGEELEGLDTMPDGQLPELVEREQAGGEACGVSPQRELPAAHRAE